jgi:hypothetical protein
MCPWRKLEPEEVAFTQRVHAVLLRAEREDMSFEEEVREYRRIEAEFVERERDSEWKVVETQRRITEWILGRALDHDVPQDVCREVWKEMLERGFTDLERRLTMSGIYARCCQMNGEFDEGLAITEPLIAELEQLLEAEATTLTPEMRFDCEQSLRIDRKIRDELKAGIRE